MSGDSNILEAQFDERLLEFALAGELCRTPTAALVTRITAAVRESGAVSVSALPLPLGEGRGEDFSDTAPARPSPSKWSQYTLRDRLAIGAAAAAFIVGMFLIAWPQDREWKPPAGVTLVGKADVEERDDAIVLRSGAVMLATGAGPLTVSGMRIESVNGRVLVARNAQTIKQEGPDESELAVYAREIAAAGLILTNEEEAMLKDVKHWVVRGGVTLCVLSGTVAVNGERFGAEEPAPANAEKDSPTAPSNDAVVEDKYEYSPDSSNDSLPAVTTLKDIEALAASGQDVTAVCASGEKFGNTELAMLVQKFPALAALYCSNCDMRDDGLQVLRKLPQLKVLSLGWCRRVTDKGLEHVGAVTTLEELDLTGFVGQTMRTDHTDPDYVDPFSKIHDSGIEHVAKLPNLYKLVLFGTGVTDVGMKTLAEAKLPELRRLDITYTNVTKAGVANLATLKLTKLCVGRCLDNGEDAAVLATLPSLRHLEIGVNGMGPGKLDTKGFAHVIGLKNLKSLSVSHYNKITAKGLADVVKLKNLEKLKVSWCEQFDDECLKAMAAAVGPVMGTADAPAWNLDSLTFEAYQDGNKKSTMGITDAGLDALTTSALGLSIGNLRLRGCSGITEGAIKRFWGAHPVSKAIISPDGSEYTPQYLRVAVNTADVHEPPGSAAGLNVFVLRDCGDDGGWEVVSLCRERKLTGIHAKDAPFDGAVVYDSGYLSQGDYKIIVTGNGEPPKGFDGVIMEYEAKVTIKQVNERTEAVVTVWPGTGNGYKPWLRQAGSTAENEGLIKIALNDENGRPVTKNALVLLGTGALNVGGKKEGLDWPVGAIAQRDYLSGFYSNIFGRRPPTGTDVLVWAYVPGYRVATVTVKSGDKPVDVTVTLQRP